MIGEIVGSYRVQKKLGEGGMGVVYIAEHPLLRKPAVVKFLHAELSRNAEIVERFFNEARSATMIRHPGIVDVFDFGHHASGCAFILMEFLDGESVADRLRKAILDAPVAIMIGRQIASAVGAAHEQGIVHRDLKPDNIFLVLDREAVGGARIKVLDFGIAKLAGESAGAVKTRTGSVMGTPSYMAPEQCRSAGEVDHRADIYALGCILFEMVCGVPPFRAQSLGQLIAAHMFEPPPPPSSIVRSVPADLEQVILRALAKETGARQASMAELSAQLSACRAAAAGATPAIWASVPRPGGLTPQVGSGAGAAGTAETAVSTTLGESSGERAVAAGIAASLRNAAPRHRRWRVRAVVATAVVVTGAAALWWRGTASTSAGEPRPAPASTNTAAPQATTVQSAQPATTGATGSMPLPAPDDRLDRSKATVRKTLSAFVEWSKTHKGAPCPRTIELATLADGIDDAWGTPVSLTCTEQPEDVIAGVISAGADRVFNTDDDLRSWTLDAPDTAHVAGPRWQAKPKIAGKPARHAPTVVAKPAAASASSSASVSGAITLPSPTVSAPISPPSVTTPPLTPTPAAPLTDKNGIPLKR